METERSAGRLLGIAVRERSRAPMRTIEAAAVADATGVADDSRGRGKRPVTLLSREAWERACRDAGADLPWTTRRANLLVEGVDLAGSAGRRLRVGEVLLEIFEEVDPCARMEAAHPGLRAALAPEWRGGAGCRVLRPGTLRVGDAVAWERGERA